MGTNRVPELLHDFVRLFTDTKDVLGELFTALGPWSYAVLFAIVFAETGLVVMPLLPGDSLLFATGALAGMGHLDVRLAAILIFCAALLGDNVNYRIGRAIGPRAFSGRYRWLKKEHLEKTRVFFERHGAKAVILARFAPIVHLRAVCRRRWCNAILEVSHIEPHRCVHLGRRLYGCWLLLWKLAVR